MTDCLQDQRIVKVVVVIVALLTTRWLYQSLQGGGALSPEQLLDDVPAPELLAQHTEEFTQEVVKVTDGIYMAVGYAIANSILIEAPEGAIIVDTTESVDAGREIHAAFRNITDLPIKVIMYTHFHADHFHGTEAFIDKSSPPEIWAHETMPTMIDSNTKVLQLAFSRAMRQFGTGIQKVAPKAFHNAGIGPFLRMLGDEATVLIQPTHLMSGDTQDVIMAGLPVTLVHIPGETTDQIGMWIPSKKAFLCGDDLYRTFPNLYAIRGTPTRDTLHWVSSLDKMISYEPEFIVPSHSRHLQGWDYIHSVLTTYRDAIKLVHDQTVRYMNKGMLPDDIVTKVQLPETLAKSPFLQTFYGTVEWSVRAVFDRYMGWFSGNIVELSAHSTTEKAKRMISLAGGVGSIIHVAKKAIEENDFKWALELATQVVTVDPSHSEAREVRLTALKALASQQMSANGRNYYLTVALEDYGFVDTKVPIELRKAVVMLMPPQKLFEALSLRLKAQEAEGVNAITVFKLTDINEVYALRIRNCVMDVLHGEPEEWKVKVTVDYKTWKGIVAGTESTLTHYMSGSLQVEGGIMEFKQFMSYLDTE